MAKARFVCGVIGISQMISTEIMDCNYHRLVWGAKKKLIVWIMARVSRGSSSKRRTEGKRAKQSSHSQTGNSMRLYTRGAMRNVYIFFLYVEIYSRQIFNIIISVASL